MTKNAILLASVPRPRGLAGNGDGRKTPLFLKGFDPWNVLSLEGAEVLHRRFLRLGNDAGELEVIDHESLSVGAGEHPVFSGVRVLVVTGLDEPTVETENGRVKVLAEGFEADFAGTIVRSGKAVELRLE